ncbi:MAG: hypothetical protein M1833_005195 [Piccolia ochrophora]|nr:MAG: hypothetical protein M1833_005195 [Piccolia ochrophora]
MDPHASQRAPARSSYSSLSRLPQAVPWPTPSIDAYMLPASPANRLAAVTNHVAAASSTATSSESLVNGNTPGVTNGNTHGINEGTTNAVTNGINNRTASGTTTATSPMSRAPITCHVLDTTTGRPAVPLHVSLTLLMPFGPSAPFTATTDPDGRVQSWASQPGPSMEEVIRAAADQGVDTVWALKFDTGSYFGVGNTFFPEVEVRFFVKGADEHYHVPLLLGPWSYTTYRGS